MNSRLRTLIVCFVLPCLLVFPLNVKSQEKPVSQMSQQELIREVEQLRSDRSRLQEVNKEAEEQLRWAEQQLQQSDSCRNAEHLKGEAASGGKVMMTVELIVSLVVVVALAIFLLVFNRRHKREVMDLKQKGFMKDRFIRNMNREIRTPLNGVCGLAQILADPSTSSLISDEEKVQLKNEIINNTEKTSMLMDDILTLNDIDNGNFTLQMRDVCFSNVCRSVIKSVKYHVPDGVRLVYSSEVTPDFVITTDHIRLERMLKDMLMNACKNTTSGIIELHVSMTNPDNKVMAFSVKDTGCGVPPEKAEIIFQRFEKLDRSKMGSGLGLPISRAIVEMLNGRIYLDTKYNKGARFVLEIPTNRV